MKTRLDPRWGSAPNQNAALRHPGDILWCQLDDRYPGLRAKIAASPEWIDYTEADRAEWFDGLASDGLRWALIVPAMKIDGSYEAEVASIAANADPATNAEFDALYVAETSATDSLSATGSSPLTRDVALVADVALIAEKANTGVLDDVEAFLSRFIAYPSEAARVAHVLWIAHTHRMDIWDSTPRIAFLSPEPGSGKSRALEVTELLVPRPVHAVNTTPAYLFRKVADDEGKPTILYDEIDTVFGPKARDNEDVRGMLNAGHRKGAVAGRCVISGKTVSTEELDAYCAVALAGLHDLPDTIATRCVIIRMRRRSPSEPVEPFRVRLQEPEGEAIRKQLADWAQHIPVGVYPSIPPQITDRNADVWEALLMIADSAGGKWSERARDAAVSFVTQDPVRDPSLGVQVLSDLREVFDTLGRTQVPTEDLLTALREMELSPWGVFELSARVLARHLREYEIRPKDIRHAGRVVKGYDKSDFIDAWERYIPFSETSATSATSATDLVKRAFSVAGSDFVADTSATSGHDSLLLTLSRLSRPPMPAFTITTPTSHRNEAP